MFRLSREMLQDTDYYQIEELAKRIEDAVAALRESYREAFVMHRFRDMSYKEIAETLGVSPKTIDYRIQQAGIRPLGGIDMCKLVQSPAIHHLKKIRIKRGLNNQCFPIFPNP